MENLLTCSVQFGATVLIQRSQQIYIQLLLQHVSIIIKVDLTHGPLSMVPKIPQDL